MIWFKKCALGSIQALLICGICATSVLSQEIGRSEMLAGAVEPHLRFKSTLVSDSGAALKGRNVVTFYVYNEEGHSGELLWSEMLLVDSDATGKYTVDLMKNAPASAREEVLHNHLLLSVRTTVPGSSSLAVAKVITTIPQGVYQDCNLDGNGCSGPAGDTALSQLDTIAAANFYVVLNYSSFWGTKAQLLAWAAHASDLGLNIIWNFTDPDFAKYANKSGNYLITDYSELSASCGCTTNKAFIQYVVNLVKTLPATYGYSIADEPATKTASNVQGLYTIVHAADSKHVTMINGTWDDATQPTLSNIEANLDPFNFADVLGGDYYPIGTGAPASDTATASSDIHTIAANYGKSSEMALQAYNWSQYDSSVCPSACTYPTTSQFQTMLSDAATDAKPLVILWYSYWDTQNLGQWSNFVSAVNPQHP